MLIGFMGFARVGKDTAVQQLGWPRRSFADALKRVVKPVLIELGIDPATEKELARPIYVAVGAAGRAKDPDFWIHRAKIGNLKRCAFSDVRYINEIRLIQNLGGVVFEIQRPGFGPANDEERRSFSEIDQYRDSLMPIPTIENSGTIEEFGKQVRERVAKWT